jgi:YVTN family beta-propeller protein
VVGAYASGITASQDGRLFVCDQGGYGDTTLIMIIDGASNTISSQMVEPSPFSLAIDGSNGLTFVATSGAPGIQQLIVLNRSYSAWIDTVPLSLNNIFPHQSSYGSFDPATGYVYVADYGGGEVSVFNGADGHLVGTIPVGVWDYGVMFVPTNGELYVTVSDQNEVLIVNTATNSVLGYVQVGGNPTGMAYDSLNGRLYVADDSSSPGPGGSVSVVDTNDNSEIATIPFPSNGYTVSILNVLLGTDGFLYALGWQYGNGVNSGILYKVNTTSDSIVAAIPAAVPDSNSGQMAEDPSGRIYIASGNFIQVFDTQRGSFVGDITAGLETTDVAYDPFTGDLLATNLVSGTVSIIPTGTTPLNVQSVTIKESGLASGATWGVGNSSVRQSTDGSLISFLSRPGSYVFSLLVPEGFSPQSVDFVVGCSAVNLNVALSPTADGETTSASESTVTIISRSTPTCTSPSTTQQPTAVGPSSGGHWLSAWVWQVALVIAVLTVLTISTLSYSFHRKSVQNSTFSRTGNTAT